MFRLWPRNKATDFWMGWWDILSAEETEIPKVPHQDQVDNFFRISRHVHKQFIQVEKTVNAEFYKGAINRPLKRIQRVRPTAFCSRNFSCCTIMRPPTKLQVSANFWPPKKLQPFVTPLLCRFISARLFSDPKLKMKLKELHFADVAEIQEGEIDELKNVKKEEFSAAFQKLYDRAKVYIYIYIYACQWSLFWIKIGMCLPDVSWFKKKQS